MRVFPIIMAAVTALTAAAGLNKPEIGTHPDDDKFSLNHNRLKAQRSKMGCDSVAAQEGKNPKKTELPARMQDTAIIYFDENSENPMLMPVLDQKRLRAIIKTPRLDLLVKTQSTRLLGDLQNERTGFYIRGHADSSGTVLGNEKISRMRAENVAKAFAQSGVHPSRICTTWAGAAEGRGRAVTVQTFQLDME